MFYLDNNSGIDVMPPQKQTISRQQKWFTEGDTQTPPSYPGADWFNIVQAELLNVLKDGDITPSKSELSQLTTAIKNIISKNQIKINDAVNNAHIKIGELDQFVRDRIPPVGVPLPWPQVYPPAGYFECNGSTFNRDHFPKLAAAYPHGFLPDLRGEFIRGWDNARGADSGRAILSWQQDAIRNIYGQISPISESFASNPAASGVFRYFEKNADHTPTHIDEGYAEGITFDASLVVPTASENRPRNVAFMYIVKAE